MKHLKPKNLSIFVFVPKRKYMKKLILFLFFIVVANSYTFSQLNVGIHGALIIGNGKYQEMYRKSYDNWIVEMQDRETNSKSGFSFGGLIETRLYSFLYLQAEINLLDHKTFMPYVSMLFSDGYPYGNGYRNVTYSFKYIEIPLLLKMKFNYDKFLPYGFAGVGVGLLNKATEKYSSVSTGDYNIYENNIHESYIKHEQTFVIAGIGVDYLLNDIFSIFATVRYSSSFVDIAKPYDDDYINFKPYNYDFLLGIKTNILNY